jgi:hypothetical protein
MDSGVPAVLLAAMLYHSAARGDTLTPARHYIRRLFMKASHLVSTVLVLMALAMASVVTSGCSTGSGMNGSGSGAGTSGSSGAGGY